MASGGPDPALIQHRRIIAWMDTALTNLADGVVLLDARARSILFANDAFARMAGRERIFLLGAPLDSALPLLCAPGSPEEGRSPSWASLASGAGRWTGNCEAQTPEGRRWLEVTASAFEWTDAKGAPIGQIVVVLRDVTQHRKAQDDLRLHAAQVEVANKELESFSYAVAHDLRAPLRSIEGFGDLLAEECGERLGSTAADAVRRIRAAAARMAQLIEDLLDLSRLSRAELVHERVDLSALAERIAEELRQGAPEREVSIVIAPGLSIERGDSSLMQVVLENLLRNSWKFTAGRAGPVIELGSKAGADGRRVFFLRDNGVGFDMDHAAKLFTPFHRLHRRDEFEGTGIGLALVKIIVEKHGGRIWAESRPGQGSTFHFTL